MKIQYVEQRLKIFVYFTGAKSYTAIILSSFTYRMTIFCVPEYSYSLLIRNQTNHTSDLLSPILLPRVIYLAELLARFACSHMSYCNNRAFYYNYIINLFQASVTFVLLPYIKYSASLCGYSYKLKYLCFVFPPVNNEPPVYNNTHTFV